MQVTQTLADGLKREFRVVVPAGDLDGRVAARLDELKDRVRINGFRPGKVPVAHLKRVYGKSVMAEVIEQAVSDANSRIVADNGLKLALEPRITFPEDQSEIEGVMEGRGDLSYTVAMEVLPKIAIADLAAISLEKPVAPVSDADIDEALNRIADENRPFEAHAEGARAADGDRVNLSFVGTIDGEPFEGGSGENIPVILGSKSFIPGFEEQVVGIGVGETRTVKVSFPTNYMAPNLAGKDASFEVTCSEISAPGKVEIGDEFAKTLGLDSLAALKDAVRGRLAAERESVSRAKVKRKLLDALDERHRFDLPAGLVDQEFENIWRQLVADMEQNKRSFADEGTTEEAARAEYRTIAERRVRLGLVLAEVGESAEVKITDDEVTRALVERARSFPGQEQQVWDYYRKNPQALAGLRAPIFEEKVVDHVLTKATVIEVPVSREDLFKADDEKA